MNVNLDKVRDDLTKVDAEIAETEQMLTSLTAQMALLQGRKTDLETFLRLAEEYQVAKVIPAAAAELPAQRVAVGQTSLGAARSRLVARPVQPVTVDKKAAAVFFQQRAAMTLNRKSDARQTKIAQRLTEAFEPGDMVTAVVVQEKLGALLDNDSRITRVHFVSSFLAREADATNGILERLEVGKYRLRMNARDLVERITATPE